MVETKGRKLGGFLLTKLLGQGAMGAVYQGKQLSLDRDVAIKVILPTYADNPDYIRRFEREAKLIAQLTHQNITQIYEFGTFDGYYLIVMEFVEGTSLKGLLSNQKKLPPYAVCEMMAQIASGLSAGASKSIVHRDIKPENIQISKAGVCKILDFGLAKDESGNAQMTMAGGILGTPSFMSPEQCQGKTVDYRADTYGLGTSAYYLLTGEVPYKADSQLAVLNMHCNAPIPDPRNIRPEIPEDLALYVMKLMSKKPEDRCKNAAQVVRDLEEILHNMKDRKPLYELSQEWDWDKMIVLPTSDGTSLLDNFGHANRNQDRTIVSGTIGGKTAQQSAFNQETIVSGSSTSMQTRGETIGQTQQYSNTQQYQQTMMPGQSVSKTTMDATLLPGGGMTQTMENTQSSTIIDQNKSKNMLMIGVAVVVVVAIGLFFSLQSSTKDWTDLDKQFSTIRDQINQDNYAGLELAKTMLEKNSDYPKKSILVEEIKTWDKNKSAFDAYKQILNATAEGNYKKAETLADAFGKNYSDSKYLTEILKEKKNWKDYAIAAEKLEKALALSKVFNYDGALDILYEIDNLYPTFDPKRVKEYIRDNEYNNRNKKKGNLKEFVDRAKVLVKAKEMTQASNLIKEIMLKGNEEEKAAIKNELDQVVNAFKSIVDKRMDEKNLINDSEEIKFIQSVASKSQEDWLTNYQKKADGLVAEYNELKKGALNLFAQKNFDSALVNIENARKIQKPAVDEAEYLNFLVSVHMGKGDEYFAKENYNEAYKSYKLGLKTRPEDPELLKRVSDTDKKLKETMKSAEADKEFAEAVKKGDALFEQKNYQDSSLSYKKALAIRPNDREVEEKVRVSSFFGDTKQLEKLVTSKEDNTELTQKTLSDLSKISVSESEKKVLSDLQTKINDKKSGYLKVSIEKAISQNSFQEASSYLKEYKALQSADNAELKKTIELFKTEALKSSDEQAKSSLYAKAYQLLELVNELTPDPRVQEKMSKIKKSRDEEKARVENAEKLNSLISEATVAYEKKQFARALEIIQKANEIDSKNVDVVRILKNAGFQNYSALGTKANEEANFEDAIKHFKKALEFDPDRPATKAILEKLERPKAEIELIDTVSKASLQQKAWAASLGIPIDKKVVISNVDFEFVLIPPGKFKMGTEEGGDGDESPARVITISKPFYMLKNEVTNEQYKVFNPGEISYSSEPKHPILGIVYTKALGFCKFLETDPGIAASVRIPTEAQWEFACRAGNKGDFSFGNKLPDLNEYGYYKDNSGSVRLVMQLKPNAFGLYDMHGNAYEWCRDFYDKKAYSITKDVDPYFGEESDQKNKTKVIRGGDFSSTPANLRSANRNSLAFAQRELLKTVGFRVIIEINPK